MPGGGVGVGIGGRRELLTEKEVLEEELVSAAPGAGKRGEE